MRVFQSKRKWIPTRSVGLRKLLYSVYSLENAAADADFSIS
jgi:hypothetical protein